MINEQEKQEHLLKNYQRYNTLKMCALMLVVVLLFALITWVIVTGRISLTENVKVLFLYIFPVGIGANTVGTWLKRRQKLAQMLKKENKRLSDNPYGYGISSKVMNAVAPEAKKKADHAELGAYWGEIRYPFVLHGVVWMRCLYAGIAAVVMNVVLRFLALGFSESELSQLTWMVFAASCVLIMLANFLRSIQIYRYGIASYSLWGRKTIFFKDIFDVNVEKAYTSKGKIESMQLDLQCIGTDEQFYISDAKQPFYGHFEKVAQVIHDASAFPSPELQKELAVKEMHSIGLAL